MTSGDDSSNLLVELIQSEQDDYESSPPKYEITTYPADFTLEVLHGKWKSGDIVIPEFQRGFVWTKRQASRLIESFLLHLPVPAVFLYRQRNSRRYLVIDGQQRLRSAFFYFDGCFPSTTGADEGGFALVGLAGENRYYNRSFEALPPEDQKDLRDAVLRAYIVQQMDPDDDTSIYHIFERLNTGGTALRNQEIRHCVYRGRFAELLIRLNKLDAWRQILGKPHADKHRADVELVLRFLATRNVKYYRAPMKDFLSRYMQAHRDAPETDCRKMEMDFERTCRAVLDAFGKKPFHGDSGRLSVAVFDAVMSAISRHLDEEVPDNLASRYETLRNDKRFIDNTRLSTTHVDTVRARFEQAEDWLFSSADSSR